MDRHVEKWIGREIDRLLKKNRKRDIATTKVISDDSILPSQLGLGYSFIAESIPTGDLLVRDALNGMNPEVCNVTKYLSVKKLSTNLVL